MRKKKPAYKQVFAVIETQSNHDRHQARIAARFQSGRATRKDWKREKRNHNKVEEK